MTRVIHTGDTHLGYQQYHVPERRDDFLAAFERVVRDAVDDEVDAVVHAGDLFHDRRPTLSDVLGTIDVLRTLDAADVPFLAVVGNHEGKRDAQWLDLFESMGLATRLDDEPVVVGDAAFYGLDYVPRSRRADLDYDFAPHDAAHAALVTHGLFEPFDFGTWDAERLVADASVDFDAILLGDNHEPETAQIEDTWLTYCGSTERVSADEREDRGYNIVTFDEDGVGISRRGIPTREFVFVDVELAEGEGADRVREQVRQYDLEDAVVVVTVAGDGEPVTPAAIEEFALEEGALVARVTDERDTPDESEIEVSFADPDDAVRERVRELGLSDAARALDETIRASKVADSNVADEVESRVRELVDEGDPSVFEPGGPADAPEADSPEAATDEAGSPGDATDAEASAVDGQDDPASQSGDADAEASAGEATGEASPGEEAGEPASADAADEQASMGEYL